jgi:hypothetical protein
MRLVRELSLTGFEMNNDLPKIHCRVFEDNSGALEMAKVHKFRPRTKHVNIKYHHLREAVENGEITIHTISTDDQIADKITKPLGESLLERFCGQLMGW